MIWPPFKAWTSKFRINNQVHFVAINYGGELKERWVILMSVLDSSVIVKVPWSQLIDTYNWECGWVDNNHSTSEELVDKKSEIDLLNLTYPSIDSGLTIPITKNIIRPWFPKN